jgi:hypothetical protein
VLRAEVEILGEGAEGLGLFMIRLDGLLVEDAARTRWASLHSAAALRRHSIDV